MCRVCFFLTLASLIFSSGIANAEPIKSAEPCKPNKTAQKKPSKPNELEVEILALVKKNMEDTAAKNMEAIMSDIHTQSPAYQTTKRMLQPLMQFDLAYEMASFKFIGTDGDYAYARVKQRTIAVTQGQSFRDNEIDILHVFRQEDGQWKFWSAAILEIRYLNDIPLPQTDKEVKKSSKARKEPCPPSKKRGWADRIIQYLDGEKKAGQKKRSAVKGAKPIPKIKEDVKSE